MIMPGKLLKILVAFLCIINGGHVFCQKKINISFQIKKDFSSPENTSDFSLRVCKFYISNLKLKKEGKIFFEERDSVHLIDLFEKEKKVVTVFIPEDLSADEIILGIGTDSAVNWQGVRSGDLDPVNGMYWTWQTGYINFKLEAKKSEEKSERKTEYHIGGFIHPFNSFKKVNIKLPTNQRKDLVICFDTDKFLSSVQEEIPESVMTPGKKSMRIAEIYSTCFQIE